jgi:membrane protease YdiL (CAAX protease family)
MPQTRHISLLLISATGIVLVALQLKPIGWILLGLACLSLFFVEKGFAKDAALIILSVGILGVTPINTDISVPHMLIMGATLGAAVMFPYLVSRFIYKDYTVRFPWTHGRWWYKTEILYIAIAGGVAYLLLPYYLLETGAYLHWPSAIDLGSVIRLFIGTNALGIWDELFFVCTVLGILRRYVPFTQANIYQAILFTSFLYELGFTGWGYIMIFIFALLQGYIFNKTHSLLYVITIHLTVDAVLFLALIHAYHPEIVPIFVT